MQCIQSSSPRAAKGLSSPASTMAPSESCASLDMLPEQARVRALDRYVDAPVDLLRRFPFLRDPTEAAQAKRVDLIRGRVIVFVCAGNYDDKKHLYVHMLREYGVRSVIVEASDNSLVKWLLGNKYIEGYVEVDMTPRASITRECIEGIVGWCQNTGWRISGVCTLWDDAVGLAARVANAFGVDHLSTLAVDIAHDKSRTRSFLESNGLPCPRNYTITTADELTKAAEVVGLPAILKPAVGNASVGVTKVISSEDLQVKYEELMRILDVTYLDGDFMGFTFEDVEDFHSCDLRNVLLESIMDGPEVDVDFVMSEGRVAYCNIVDDWPYEEPYYIELGNNCPTNLSEEDAARLKMAATDIVTTMGCYSGILHVEMKLTSAGPMLIEVNPRLGGGAIPYFHRNIYGVDLLLEQCLAAAGIPCNPPVSYSGRVGVSVHFFAPESGVVEVADATLAAESNANIGFCSLGVRAGDRVTCWNDGFPPHVGRVDLIADSFEDAVAQCRDVERLLVWQIKE
ncbi:MAG: hypothetical protein KVP17_002954 [Porospora cf. gigantea B]|uniref:uncharacterized protein n=2 Tax=Porospora cf. gigantea B TaxID=2853592 RepID=UPI003571F679|nr:MAG: hypothetical protein KVP17_002954 [Porospora cf. gigantea B]